AYIPRYRIKVEEIAGVWGADAQSYRKGLLVEEKSVPAPDQDTITMAVEASKRAIKRAGIDPREIGAVYVGSESHPYAVKPSGTVLAEAIGACPEVHTADLEFACKAGTEGMYLALSLVKAGEIKYGLGVGADTSQGAPGDALEYTTAAGAAAFIFGRDKVVAEVIEVYSFTTDTPDFWRREYQYYPRHGSRFTGEPAYFKHIIGAAKGIMDKAGVKPEEINYVIFHQPNGKFPLRVGEMLGFKKEQIDPGLLVTYLGNTYSGSSPMGLTATFDIAKPGDIILLVSYGSGAGSDAFLFKMTDRIDEVRDLAPKTWDMLKNRRVYVDYGTYAKFRKKIRKAME
ncbi:MAG: hydroxymethylglutaryl-CoA synthase, partial [Candidatus Aminicenantes bacterium]|nr:hydroxymethylglutaryl-CoA synthase [Candidatus Aminicenantes bacterium]